MSLNIENKLIPMEVEDLGEEFVGWWLELPPLVSRPQFCKTTRIYSAGTMANFDSAGEGPAGRKRIGNRIFYCRTAALIWLHSRVKTIGERNSVDTTVLKSLEKSPKRRKGGDANPLYEPHILAASGTAPKPGGDH